MVRTTDEIIAAINARNITTLMGIDDDEYKVIRLGLKKLQDDLFDYDDEHTEEQMRTMTVIHRLETRLGPLY